MLRFWKTLLTSKHFDHREINKASLSDGWMNVIQDIDKQLSFKYFPVSRI